MKAAVVVAVLVSVLVLAIAPGFAAARQHPSATTMTSQPQQLHGIVTSVNPSKHRLMISSSKMVINLAPGATVMRNGKKVALSDLKTGDAVVVAAHRSGTRLVATRIDLATSAVAGAREREMTGVVKSVDTRTNTLTLQSGETIHLMRNTRVMENNRTIMLSQIKPGMHVRVTSRDVKGRMEASQVVVTTAPTTRTHELTGTVKSVDRANNTFTLDSGQTIRVDSRTRMLMGTQSINLSQLKPGDKVRLNVMPERGNTYLASRVDVTSSASTR